MSGETEAAVSAWTVDSLRDHLTSVITEKDERISERDRRYEQRFESQEKAITTAMTAYGTAVTLAAERSVSELAAIQERYDLFLAERDLRYGERFEASQEALTVALAERDKALQAALVEREKAIQAAFEAQEMAVKTALEGIRDFYDTVLTERDKRYQARAEASDHAVTIALATLEKEFHERIRQVREETVLAMAAAEKAIVKAEMATEKRFECVSSDTPILCADLTWRPAGDLLAGDELIAFDEKSPNRRGRRFRRATVTDNSLARDALLLVTTPLGSVRCNAEHPWLVQRQAWEWVKAQDIQAGDVVLHPVDTWEVDRSWESGWLAGMYDGEGCLSHDKNGSVQLSLTQRESDTSDRIVRALKERVDTARSYRVEPGKYLHTQAFFHFLVNIRADVMKILGSVRPPRLLVTADTVWEGKPIGGRHRTTVVTSVESAGTGMIAQLSTSTGTYIAGGFAMHNSVNEFRAQQADIIMTFARKSEVDTRLAGLSEKIESAQASILQLGGATMPRNEYDRAHTDLADKVIAVDKAMNEKLEAHTKAVDSRIALLQSQVSNIEAITR